MSELISIFETWYNTEHNDIDSDNKQIKKLWQDMESYLHEQCSEQVFEQINDYILEFSKEIEQQAFITGYTKANITVFKILQSSSWEQR
jgi:hypothetical protein